MLRAVGFATALRGEAALLHGDLELAEQELTDSLHLHHELALSSGEAHALQRLAEVHLARGERELAMLKLERALVLARWSPVALHLIHRIVGSMILAQPDPAAARAMVDRAVETMGQGDHCFLCIIMFEVPATRACAAVGDLQEARAHLAAARGVRSTVGGRRVAGSRARGAGQHCGRRGRRAGCRPDARRGHHAVRGGRDSCSTPSGAEPPWSEPGSHQHVCRAARLRVFPHLPAWTPLARRPGWRGRSGEGAPGTLVA